MILRSRTKHDLSDEMVLEILVRLPVKSLLRFRCVCKTWYSYFTNPNFISTHLLCYNNHDGGYVIHMPRTTVYMAHFHRPHSQICTLALDRTFETISDDGGYVIHMPRTTVYMAHFHRPHSQICTLALDRTFETISEFRIPFTFQSEYPNLVGSCNGILCFTDFFTSKSKDMYLWNPSIRKFKRLPDTCLNQNQTQVHVAHGFGYDSLNNDYKVVRFSWTGFKWIPPPEVEVYSLSSDSWKSVELGISWRPNVASQKFNYILPFPFVSGHLHWMIEMTEEGGGQETGYTSMILSFDVNSEKFKELPLPVPDEGGCISKCLTSYKEKLAVIKIGDAAQPYSMLCSIWVMREYGVLNSWNIICVLPMEICTHFIGVTKYGLLLFQNSLVSTNSELERKDKSVLIDPEALHEEEISNQINYLLDVATYMENLALLDGANVVSY